MQRNCVMADDEAGVVVCYVVADDSRGKYQTLAHTNGEIHTITKSGKVRIYEGNRNVAKDGQP